ncbi:MAG TPA: hypothetical protein ENK23_01685, partial [Sorangium sp.]|nr:hypothetical protein [Sorangium sp.]
MMRRLIAISLFLSPLVLAPGCDTAADICSLVCECEHCADMVEFYRCQQIDSSRQIADVYDCTSEWDAYADCYQQKGRCDERAANFTTRKPVSCSGTSDTGVGCTTDSDCADVGVPNASCVDMSCQYRSCADPQGGPCEKDSDCRNGDDECQSEKDDLR